LYASCFVSAELIKRLNSTNRIVLLDILVNGFLDHRDGFLRKMSIVRSFHWSKLTSKKLELLILYDFE